MPVAVLAAVDDPVVPADHATAEIDVRGSDARVDHVGLHPAASGVEVTRPAGGVLIRAIERQVRLVDAVQAPGRGRLDGVESDDGVRLGEQHSWGIGQLGGDGMRCGLVDGLAQGHRAHAEAD